MKHPFHWQECRCVSLSHGEVCAEQSATIKGEISSEFHSSGCTGRSAGTVFNEDSPTEFLSSDFWD